MESFNDYFSTSETLKQKVRDDDKVSRPTADVLKAEGKQKRALCFLNVDKRLRNFRRAIRGESTVFIAVSVNPNVALLGSGGKKTVPYVSVKTATTEPELLFLGTIDIRRKNRNAIAQNPRFDNSRGTVPCTYMYRLALSPSPSPSFSLVKNYE